MANNYISYIPFSPSNYSYIETVDDKVFYVRGVTHNVSEFTLYQNSAEPNRVDKTPYLTAVATIEGVFRNSTSITSIELTFESVKLPQFNYCYIPAFNRYYFVDDIYSIRYGLWKLSLTVDPLMTYRDAILSCYAFVDRNEFDYNDNIIDKKTVIEQGVDIDVVEFGNDILNTTNKFYRYCITGYKIGVGTSA